MATNTSHNKASLELTSVFRFVVITALGYLALTGLVWLVIPTVKAEVAVSPERQQALLYLLRQDCGSCHGMRLKGGLGPSLLKADLAGKPRDFLIQTIRDGRPNTAMPPWKGQLSDSEIAFLVDFLLSDDNRVIESEPQSIAESAGVK